MIKNRTNFVFLVFFQLLIFVIPLFIKGAHVHRYSQNSKLSNSCNKSITKTEHWCPICKYEFVSKIVDNDIQYNLVQQTIDILYFGLIHQIFKISFTSCLLRAPPANC